MSKELGEFITGQMKLKDLTQEALAAASGLSQALISELVNVKKPYGGKIKEETLVKLARGLGIDLEGGSAACGIAGNDHRKTSRRGRYFRGQRGWKIMDCQKD